MVVIFSVDQMMLVFTYYFVLGLLYSSHARSFRLRYRSFSYIGARKRVTFTHNTFWDETTYIMIRRNFDCVQHYWQPVVLTD